MTLTSQLHEIARDKGAARTGVCDVEPFVAERAELRERVANGMYGGLTFTFSNPERATDIRGSFPWAHRLFVAGWAYLPGAGSPGPPEPGTARVARFATRDHYVPLRLVLADVAAALEGAGYRAVVLVDDNRLVDRGAAVRSGVGWWGKNTMVLAPGVGPWMLLGSVVTDAPLDVDAPMVRDCGSCDACLPACPTGALVAPGVLDARRCLAAMLQQAGKIPLEYRVAVGDRLYGCDDCLDACPPGGRLAASSVRRVGRHDIVSLLAMDDSTLLNEFEHFYVPKRRAAILRRNALVVLGNVGTPDDIPLLAGFLSHPLELLRCHAAWAIGRIGGPHAVDVLAAADRIEPAADVQAELRDALADARTTE